MLNTQKIAFKAVKNVSDLVVKPYLSMEDQSIISEVYLEEYFSRDETLRNYVFKAEFIIILSVLDKCTNVDTSDLDVDDVLKEYQIWKAITSQIKNYGEFRALLKQTVEEEREVRRIENSIANKLGSIVDGLINGISELADKEISPETLKNASELLEKTKDSEVLKALAKKEIA